MQFILESFKEFKAKDSGFTVRKWADQMGLESPALLVMILKGQKALRVGFTDFLARGLALDEAEKLYFKTLILRKNARSDDEREVFDSILAALSPGKNFSADYSESESVFDHWSTLTLLTAAKIPGFSVDPEKVRECFLAEVDPSTLRNGLRLLEEEGLMRRDGGKPSPVYKRVSSQNDKKNAGARRYFRQVFDMAKDAIEMPLEEREFQSFSLAIDEGKLSTAKELIRDLRNRLAALEGSDANRVYHANLQFFPMTKRIDN